ncbi:MBOAT family O-acyltransferase [Mucilaginibacter sp. AW1-3]
MCFVPKYIVILGFTIVVDYFAGILIQDAKGHKRKLYLTLSILANVGVLAIFKYYNFFTLNLNEHVGTHLPLLKILLPIGLSFHTFQAMSYTIEVYRGNQKAEKHFGIYSLYVMFYPQLVAGPIERPQNLLHQFWEEHHFDFEEMKSGLVQMAFGFFKKVVIADRLSVIVDHSYGHYQDQTGLSLLIATFFYAFEIYCDFSGYSDIAIGAARIMGFKLMTNFNAPYFSKSIAEFWKRWHISLSTWFKDYLYISLGGNRVSSARVYFNLFVVFMVSGLWHGANWTFIAWGAIHGVMIVINRWMNKVKHGLNIEGTARRAVNIFKMSFTFILVSLAWVLFRAANIHQSLFILNRIFHFSLTDQVNLKLNNVELIFSFLLIVILMLKEKFFLKIKTENNVVFTLLIVVIPFLCFLFGVFDNKQFIYFQF